MKEKDLLAAVRQLARRLGWMEYHTYRSTKSPAGFPDLVLVRPPRLIFVELKTEKGKLSEAQDAWINALVKTNVEVAIWRPHHLTEGLIDFALR